MASTISIQYNIADLLFYNICNYQYVTTVDATKCLLLSTHQKMINDDAQDDRVVAPFVKHMRYLIHTYVIPFNDYVLL